MFPTLHVPQFNRLGAAEHGHGVLLRLSGQILLSLALSPHFRCVDSVYPDADAFADQRWPTLDRRTEGVAVIDAGDLVDQGGAEVLIVDGGGVESETKNKDAE